MITGDAEIRISFDPGGSWSYVGTACLMIQNQLKPTMNFGWLNHNASESEFASVILHEFGHSLGCVHEHQRPDSPLNWDKAVVYSKYLNDFGWDSAMVDDNVFKVYNQLELTNSSYDACSIMHYDFPKEFFTDDKKISRNICLSQQGLDYIKKIYPASDKS